MSSSPTKRSHGQFFTRSNPFDLAPFRQWWAERALAPGDKVLEPFAGANHLVLAMKDAGAWTGEWACFDIDPNPHAVCLPPIQRQDTLADFPKGYKVALTNPPYLARNSATRRGLHFPDTRFDDLYKHALAIMLEHVPFVAAIIPESFITSGLFHDRLDRAISLTMPMFQDTEHPVCLALFSPASTQDFEVWEGNTFLGNHQGLTKALSQDGIPSVAWKFNDPFGAIGLRAVDNGNYASIMFIPGEDISPDQIKVSSRAFSRISGVPLGIVPDQLIIEANREIDHWRAITHDVLMTPFKGLRSDGRYRRRLDFSAARLLLDRAAHRILNC